MIYGNPFEFSIQYDVVKEWNQDGNLWKNGLVFICINGKKLGLIDVVELRTAIAFYRKSGGVKIACSEKNIDFEKIFRSGMDLFYGNSSESIGSVCDLTCSAFGDSGIFIFYTQTSNNDVLVWRDGGESDVEGKVLPLGTVTSVLLALPSNI